MLFIYLSVSLKPTILSHRATISMGSTTTESPPPLPLTGDTNYINVQDFNQVNVAALVKTVFQWPIPQHIMDNIPPYLDPSSPFTLGVTDVFAEIEIQGIEIRLLF